MCPVRERPLKPMAKGQLRFTPFVSKWLTTGRETTYNNERCRLEIFLLLFLGEYQSNQTCCRVLIDKLTCICEMLTRTEILGIIIIGLVHGNYRK